MKWKLAATALGAALLASAGIARADGERNIYKGGNYT
ncbi:putrescine/spermidine ABC transporter substrate-binding protein, partial [Mesorhizobium sp. M6A.T.Ca.TU.002.02.2.1]